MVARSTPATNAVALPLVVSYPSQSWPTSQAFSQSSFLWQSKAGGGNRCSHLYVLMSVFHAAPRLRFISSRQNGSGNLTPVRLSRKGLSHITLPSCMTPKVSGLRHTRLGAMFERRNLLGMLEMP